MKDIFWLDYPLILFKKDQIFQLWPSTDLTVEKKLDESIPIDLNFLTNPDKTFPGPISINF